MVVRGAGDVIARHPQGTRALLVIDPDHYEGTSTDRVLRPIDQYAQLVEALR